MLLEDYQDAIDQTIAFTQSRALTLRWNYYVGNQPKIYLTPKLAETFRALSDSLTENYCGFAVNSRVHRMEINGWDGDGAVTAQELWEQDHFPLRQDAFYRWGLVHGHAYIAVTQDGVHANPANVMYAQPDPDDWMAVAWAGKCWVEGNTWYVSVWDDDNVRRYEARGQTRKQARTVTTPPGAKDFKLLTEERHGFERVPVIAVNPYGYLGAPLIDQISPIQDRINKITANKLVAAEFGAFKQRVFFTRQEVTPEAIRQQPDTAIVLDPGDSDARASVQELGGTDLHNYDDAKNSEVDALFTIASLPKHMRVNAGSDASGEAIKADEGPFVEAIIDHQRELGSALQQAFQMLDVDANPVWRDPTVNDDLSNAKIVETRVGAGIPWQVAAVKYLGMTPTEIEEAQALVTPSPVAQQTNAFLSNPLLADEL